MDLLLPTQTWIGRHTELSARWAQSWRGHSSKPWGHAWVHLVQALAAADAGEFGLAARAEGSGLGLEEARTIEADWSAIHGVQWREASPPLWAADSSIPEILVPTPPVPWARLRGVWRARHGDVGHTSAWAVLQWALQVVPLEPEGARPCSMKDLAAVLNLSEGTLGKARQKLVTAGLLADRRSIGRSSVMSWPTPFAGGARRTQPAAEPSIASTSPAPPVDELVLPSDAVTSPSTDPVAASSPASATPMGDPITAQDRFVMERAMAFASSGTYMRLRLGSSVLEFNPPPSSP